MNGIILAFTTTPLLVTSGKLMFHSGLCKASIQSQFMMLLRNNSRPKHALPSSGSKIYGINFLCIAMRFTVPIFMMQYYSMACVLQARLISILHSAANQYAGVDSGLHKAQDHKEWKGIAHWNQGIIPAFEGSFGRRNVYQTT